MCRVRAGADETERRRCRLARHLALHVLHDWGIPYRSDASEAAALIVAELAANAATHGRVPGRDFELRLTHAPGDTDALGVLRIEVSDMRGERRPPGPGGLGAVLRLPEPFDLDLDTGEL
ncbi:ATP-binding protein [Streptomyces sp. NBC_01618]|uniref:ATP-binding protein n=1 Tax=Streptomyces sp. NBC_01618 TaxID=2975900 RepID=UPI003868FDE6|nr:ATP-binding protein [Streptomyces sp. NBC_01618]